MTLVRHLAAAARALPAAALIAASAAGCKAPPEGCPPAGETSLESGTGVTAFRPLSDGDDLPFYFGTQGGYHAFVSLRIAGLEPGDPSDPFGEDSPLVTIELRSGGRTIGEIEEQPALFEEEEDGLVRFGERVVLDVADPGALHGEPATLRAEVEDRCGRRADDRRDVVMRLSENP